MNNLFVDIPGQDGVLEVTPHGVSVVSSYVWNAYGSFIIWSEGEFFHLERDSSASMHGLEYAYLLSNVAGLAHRGLARFACTSYSKTVTYRIEHLGHSERLVVLTATGDCGSIIYPSGARYDGFATRLVDDFVMCSVYHSGCLFEAEFVFEADDGESAKAFLWEACHQAIFQDYGYWESHSIFDGGRQLYKVRRML